MFCPFAAPVGLNSFDLLSLCRPRRSRYIPSLAPTGADVWVHTVCVQTRCRHQIGDNMLTKYQMIKFIDFCEVWFLPESVAKVDAIAGDHRCHTPRH
ncbi:hypothetical protein TNCV_3760041 [Trichonephila clavipes]|nr:hypothetical protein TNCV_3760041 [Trichonephila clavipes]